MHEAVLNGFRTDNSFHTACRAEQMTDHRFRRVDQHMVCRITEGFPDRTRFKQIVVMCGRSVCINISNFFRFYPASFPSQAPSHVPHRFHLPNGEVMVRIAGCAVSDYHHRSSRRAVSCVLQPQVRECRRLPMTKLFRSLSMESKFAADLPTRESAVSAEKPATPTGVIALSAPPARCPRRCTELRGRHRQCSAFLSHTPSPRWHIFFRAGVIATFPAAMFAIITGTVNG